MTTAVQKYSTADQESDFDSNIIQPRRAKASPRKKGGPGAKRPSSAPRSVYSTSASGKTARELWLGAVNQPGAADYEGHSEGSAMSNSFSGLKKTQAQNMSYSSTSHYLRQLVGTERAKKGGAIGDNTTPRAAPGTPAYKTPEEYYDEILELKKEIQALKKDNSTLRLRARRIEEDNIKKEKQIEQLLDPSKSEDMRRTLGNGKQDTATVIHSLKQKILKLEHQLKDKEAEYNKLASDMKTTKVDEMKTQMEAFYREILRLNELKSVDAAEIKKKQQTQMKETPSRLKAMQETVLRMNEKNVKLQAENKSLKTDLDKMMAEVGVTKEKHEQYEDMTKKELLASISKLEKRLDKAEESTSLISDVEARSANIEGKLVLEGSLAQRLDQLDKRETELLDDLKKKDSVIRKLKEDRAHYRKKTEEKQKEVKSLRRELDELQAELDGFYDRDKSAVTPRADRSGVATPRGSETPRSRRRGASPRATASSSTTPRGSASAREKRRQSSASSSSESQRRKVEAFRENHAAKTIQHGWRSHRQYTEEKEKEERSKKVQEFTENRAAKRIQRGWIDRQARHLRDEEDNEAAEMLQAALRNHRYRAGNVRHRQDESEEEEDVDDTDSIDSASALVQSSARGYKSNQSYVRVQSKPPVQPRRRGSNTSTPCDEELETLQTFLKAHLYRKRQLEQNSLSDVRETPSRGGSRHSKTSKSSKTSRHSRLDSEGEEVEDDAASDYRPTPRSSNRGSVQRSRPSSARSKASSRPRTPTRTVDSDEDSDDDLVMTGGRRTKIF